ncbi:hypothetical protein LFZ43_22825 [Salmonella enterica subsp. enterica serovar Wandsworth str. SA20092095]|nr:hypothetical protein LFZ43_22825 [Salmonella enterica subsp. enterica serovar Wandsworth str. SA20092095]
MHRLRFSGPKTSIIRTPTTSLKNSIKTITNLSDTNCLEIHGASLGRMKNLRLTRVIRYTNANKQTGIKTRRGFECYASPQPLNTGFYNR